MTTFKESITGPMAPVGPQDAMDDLLPPSTHVQDMATAYEAADNQEDKGKSEDGNATGDTGGDYCINATPAQWQRGADAAAGAAPDPGNQRRAMPSSMLASSWVVDAPAVPIIPMGTIPGT